MFKRLGEEDIGNVTQLKSSVARGIRAKVLETYPSIEAHIDEILPKKKNLTTVKCPDYVTLILVDLVPVFFQLRDTPPIPTLKILHQYPMMMPHMQCDKGAIKFVLSGANIMCPGLTSKGGKMTEGIAQNTVVAIMAEGKEHAMGIGLTKMSTDEIRTVNRDIAIDNLHYLNDALWKLKSVA
eukprot:GILJ01001511.1.p1 GENE.GILJ01001511.1~~GILJ01001511.1.p1  ORF type:complete len:182 (-),score=28.68 GILJ01001511.1:60-605(-)